MARGRRPAPVSVLLGQRLHFWTAGPNHQRALVGVKLEQAAGEVPVQVKVGHGGGTLEAQARILAKEFPRRELKVQGKELSCARLDVKETQKTKSKKTVEGSYWLSSQVPGLLVKSVAKVTEGKDVTETTVQTIKFEAKK